MFGHPERVLEDGRVGYIQPLYGGRGRICVKGRAEFGYHDAW